MIRVSVTLLPWHGAPPRELARMDIANDAATTMADPSRGSYNAVTYRGRSTEDLDKGLVSRHGAVHNWPREALHVWNLVFQMLRSMGYDATQKAVTLAGPEFDLIPILVGYRCTRVIPAGGVPVDFWPIERGDPGEGWEPLYVIPGVR